MRKIISLFFALMSVVMVSAQMTSAEWLSALDRSLGERYGMYISVAMADQEPISGYFMVDGDGYYITLGVMEVYSDGKLRYEINNERKEATIDSVDLSSCDLLTNPTNAFSFVDEEFAIRVVASSESECVLSLVPRDEAMGVTEILLALERSGSRVVPQSITYDYDGERIDVALKSADVAEKSLPRWDKDAYRAYDVVSFL